MKKLIPFLVAGLIACSARAELDFWSAYVADVSTNAAAIAADTVTSSTKFKGWIDCIVIDRTCVYSGATNTVTVATAGGSGLPAARTIYSQTLTGTNTVVYPRQICDTTTGTSTGTNELARIATYGDKLVVTAYANTSTNTVTSKVFIYISDVP